MLLALVGRMIAGILVLLVVVDRRAVELYGKCFYCFELMGRFLFLGDSAASWLWILLKVLIWLAYGLLFLYHHLCRRSRFLF